MGGRVQASMKPASCSLWIQSRKEIVIILSETDMTDAIVSSIRTQLNIDDPGKGIIYIQNVNKVYGIYK